MKQFKIHVTVNCADEKECRRIAQSLAILATKCPVDDLEFVAQKFNTNPEYFVSMLRKYKHLV